MRQQSPLQLPGAATSRIAVACQLTQRNQGIPLTDGLGWELTVVGIGFESAKVGWERHGWDAVVVAACEAADLWVRSWNRLAVHFEGTFDSHPEDEARRDADCAVADIVLGTPSLMLVVDGQKGPSTM